MTISKFDGIPVLHCLPGSPAARAGVRVGDRLLFVNGRAMKEIGDYLEARDLDEKRLTITLLRSNVVHELCFELDGLRAVPESTEAASDTEPASGAEAASGAKKPEVFRKLHLRSRRQVGLA